MDLKLYDTLTREKRRFVPLDAKRVRMYVCGPTVYDFAHIGNARPVIVFDVLFRLLRHLYGAEHVAYVRNITDVDDKINARAAEQNIPIGELTDETYGYFKVDAASLGCLTPEKVNLPGKGPVLIEPRATQHISEMRELIERLIKSGHAYIAEEHVLFSVPSMPDYGQLSKQSLDEIIAGARVDVAPYKRSDMDFVLWKPSKPDEPHWPSPAGIATPGRPGWHIECSAMAWKHLGETFDIHGGGIDLVFPHHENEIAQSRCAFGSSVMANYWMHNGFLQVEGEKMSKSLGNFFTIRELNKSRKFGGRRWSGGILKFAMLQTHYRQPIDWTVSLLEQSEARLEKWRKFAAERTARRSDFQLMNSFVEALADDLNTPAAFAIVDRAVNEETGLDETRYTVYQILKFLGIKGEKTRVARTTTKIQELVRALGTFSQNDWSNLAATLASRPLFRSGTLKPESKLLVALDAISELARKLAPRSPDVVPIQDFKTNMIMEGSPAESDFETQVRRLVAARLEARRAKNWAESDRIRDELTAMGVVLRDFKDDTTWEVAR